MATIMLRNNFPDFFGSLLAALDTVYLQSRDLDESNAAWKKLFAMKPSKRMFENMSGVSGFPTMGPVAEAANYQIYDVVQLWDRKWTHTKYGGGWQVSEEMEDDDQFEIVANNARAFARSYRFTKEVVFANIFNESFGTETAGDGSAICATHTLYSGSTIANNAATDFGVSAAQTMFNHFATCTDDRGIRIRLTPKFFVANPAMRWVFSEVMKSELKPYTSDNEVNALNEETLTPIYWPEITDTDAWWVSVDPKDLNGTGLRAYDRQPFTVSSDFNVANTTMISVGRGRYSVACGDWRQVYGSTGA